VALLACGAAYRKKREKVIPFLSRSSGQVIFLSRAKVSDLTFMLRSGSPLPSALEGKKDAIPFDQPGKVLTPFLI